MKQSSTKPRRDAAPESEDRGTRDRGDTPTGDVDETITARPRGAGSPAPDEEDDEEFAEDVAEGEEELDDDDELDEEDDDEEE